MKYQNWIAIGWAAAFVCWTSANAYSGESALPLLSGFDAARMEAVYPPEDDESAGELAKLLYRLRSVDAKSLQTKVDDARGARLGDAVDVDGEIQEIEFLKVPSRLIEFVEFSELQMLVVGTGPSKVRVVTTMLPNEAKLGDRVSGVGVVIELDDSSTDADEGRLPLAIASARLRWYPDSPESTGWQLLSEAGMDVSLIADVASRSRRPLLAEDGDAFYSMLAAAATVANRDHLPAATLGDPVRLLSNPEKLGGQWLRMNLETVQVTRIAVTEPDRQTQLGSDHYFQIDAMADLGNVVVKIEPTVGDVGPTASFQHRYPVSVVVRDLPPFLSQQIRAQAGGDAIVSDIKLMVGVDVFFFRLWSYATDFMNQYGGQDQFGPLLIAARIHNQSPTSRDPAGVVVIGWIAAVAVILAIVATWWWSRRVTARDLEIRERRKSRESEQLQIP